eukprot:symbB.v1.2.017548.t1/scaffold1371.1/size209032/20
MARKSRGRGGGGRGRGRRTTGIEKYGQDEEDEFLALDDKSAEEAEHEDEEDEDVMALKPFDDSESYVKPKKNNKAKGAKGAKASDEESEVDLEPVSKGWGRHDFYGGEDAGDDSEGASDEDRTFKEAKKLEELRALRLQDLSDPLAALLGDGDATTKATEESGVTTEKSAAEVEAQFESMFTEEAEKSQVNRDLSQLSDAKRKSLLKKEAPELLPLLQDFQSKLESLSPLLPLLKPGALSELPASGAAYATARISLLLNHLANLSFYLLMKAEGGDVRSHPVVSQLVWLRELEEHLQPLNKRLDKKMQKAAKEARKRSRVSVKPAVPKAVPVMPEAAAKTKTPLTLAERLEKLRGKVEKKDEAKAQQKGLSALDSAISSSLLKLPGKRKAKLGSGDGPADLDEIDPTLGAWLPSSSLSQQLSEVQQHLRERKAKDLPQASDKNPDARERQHREKLRLEVDPIRETDHTGDTNEKQPSSDEDEMIKEAKATAKAKKEQKAAALSAKEKAKVARQYHPEVKLEGRRGTSKQILENRGLVRHRKRKAGNARVSNREKYDKLVKRRKGAVQEMREAAPDGATYEGEATGVRTHLRKSLKLN